jgi:hypothetical protein
VRLFGGGFLTALAQTFEGVKTFASKIVAAAGIEITSGIWSTLGAGASDVCITVGSSVADGAVNANAKLLSLRTGVGGTEVEKGYFLKGGHLVLTGGLQVGSYNGLGLNSTSGPVRVGVSEGTTAFLAYVGGHYVTDNGTAVFRSGKGAGASDICVKLGTSLADGSVVGSACALSVRTGITGTEVEKWGLLASGLVRQPGTDSSASPGAATINKPLGKSAIAAGAASVVVTNSLVTAASHVLITPHARDATCLDLIVVPAAGSFTVSGTAAATTDLPFSWEVKTLT